MEAFLPDFYYSPKTYGLEGLSYKGFEVDQLFTAGSNIASPDDLPTDTYGILKYYIKRSILTGILGIFAFFDQDAVDRSESHFLGVIVYAMAAMSGFVAFLVRIDDSKRWIIAYIKGFLSNTFSVVKNVSAKVPIVGSKLVTFIHYFSEYLSLVYARLVPKQKTEVVSPIAGPVLSSRNIAMIIHSNEFVAPPPPVLPTPEEEARMPAEEVTELHKEISFYKETQKLFYEVETKRVINEAAMLIHWAFVLNLQHITLCEYLGYLSSHSTELIDAVKTVFLNAHEKMPQMSFVVPSEESILDVTNTADATPVSRDLSSSSAMAISRPASSSYGNGVALSGGSIRSMKIVLLDQKNGKRLTLKGLKSACVLVQKTGLEPENVERSVESFMEQYGITSFGLVIAAGPTAVLDGLPPLSVKNAHIYHHKDQASSVLSTNILSNAIQFYIKKVSEEIQQEE